MSNDLRNESNDQISRASTVVSECQQVGTAVNGTAQRLVKQPSIENIPMQTNGRKNTNRPDVSVTVPLPIGKRNRYERTCEACGDSFIAKRPWGKFCSGACRVAAFRARQ